MNIVRRAKRTLRTWTLLLVLLDLVGGLALLGVVQWRYDPMRNAEGEYHRLALEIERNHPWADVISLGKEDMAVWCYVDVGAWYADPGHPDYNIFALAADVCAALEQLIDEDTKYIFIGHMRWDPDAHGGEGRYAIRQPWFWGPSTFRYYGALYPAVYTTWWQSGYLAPDSYRWIGNPYATWWVRWLSYL